MKIVCDDRIPYLRGAFEPFAMVEYVPGAKISPEDVRDADALIVRTRTACGESLLKDSKVKVVATTAIGYDHIDTAWCDANGIFWSNAPGCNSVSVTQYVASVLFRLALKHDLDLKNMTLGVVGVGNVGMKVARMAETLGMKVLLNDPPRSRKEGTDCFVTLDRLLRESDIITLHVPLSMCGDDATWHLFDGDHIAEMRPGQYLINTSRGAVVDNVALKESLLRHTLSGAVLDVWENEPDIDRELLGLLDISTPHIAGYSADGKSKGTAMSVHSVAAVLGLPLMEWGISGIPKPSQSLSFEVEAEGRSLQSVLSEALLHTYDVQDDSDALRMDPASFEKLRGDYAIRREPAAFTVNLHGGTDNVTSALESLGFEVKSL